LLRAVGLTTTSIKPILKEGIDIDFFRGYGVRPPFKFKMEQGRLNVEVPGDFASVKKLNLNPQQAVLNLQAPQLTWYQAAIRAQEAADAPYPLGSISAGKVWSMKSRLKAAELPIEGKIRFVPRDTYNPTLPLPRGPKGGYMDRFDNEWVPGPSRTQGQDFEWDVQLSRTGKAQLGWASRDGKHINISLDGRITHR
jgi:hypothetical protein